MLKSAVLIMLCIFLIKLYPKRNMVLNGFNKTRLYSDNKIWGTFTKQRSWRRKLLYLWDLFFQIMYHSWNNFLIHKKKKIFYIQKSTVHSVTLILDDPLYISNFDTRKVMPFLFLKTCMYLLFCTLHLFYTYFIFFKFTSGYILTWSLIRWWSRLQIRCCTCTWVIKYD